MRKFLAVIVYTLIVLFLGRSLLFLPPIQFVSTAFKNPEKLEKQLKAIAARQKGNYSVYVYDFSSGASAGVNEKTMHIAASVNKVPIIFTLYYLASKGSVNLDERISLQKEDIQDYGTGKLRYEKPGSAYAIRSLAKLALEQSDNTAAYIIASKIGMKKIQQTINTWGLTQTDMDNNKTSVYDMFLLFKKLRSNEITNPALTKELMDYLQDTDFEDRIPLYLPASADIVHKTGDTVGGVHDVGIVKDGDVEFFIGVMTADIADTQDDTKKTIGQLTKTVYDYLKLE